MISHAVGNHNVVCESQDGHPLALRSLQPRDQPENPGLKLIDDRIFDGDAPDSTEGIRATTEFALDEN